MAINETFTHFPIARIVCNGAWMALAKSHIETDNLKTDNFEFSTKKNA